LRCRGNFISVSPLRHLYYFVCLCQYLSFPCDASRAPWRKDNVTHAKQRIPSVHAPQSPRAVQITFGSVSPRWHTTLSPRSNVSNFHKKWPQSSLSNTESSSVLILSLSPRVADFSNSITSPRRAESPRSISALSESHFDLNHVAVSHPSSPFQLGRRDSSSRMHPLQSVPLLHPCSPIVSFNRSAEGLRPSTVSSFVRSVQVPFVSRLETKTEPSSRLRSDSPRHHSDVAGISSMSPTPTGWNTESEQTQVRV
jgi:hypothetical protein